MKYLVKMIPILIWLGASVSHAAELPLPFDTELGQKYRAELEFVMVPPDTLPEGLVLAQELDSAPIYPATTNPQATEDTEPIEFVTAMLGARRLNLAGVKAAVTALYFDRGPGREIGVWGLRFEDEVSAGEAYRQIILAVPIQKERLVLKGAMVVMVWRDEGVTDASYMAVKSHIEQADID